MQNKIDYQIHKTYTPPYYHRQYENDLLEKSSDPSYVDTAKRAVHIAVPFLSLYKPLAGAISLGMGSLRVLTNGVGALNAKDGSSCAFQVIQVGLATLALAGTLYHFTLGLYLTTGADLITNLATVFKGLYNREYRQAGEAALQALTSSLYLAIMVLGSLEVILASILVQALVSLYQARDEWQKGRTPEAIAKSLMGMIRLYQAGGQAQLIQKRNRLQTRYQGMIKRIQDGKKIDHLWDHPLVKGAKLTDLTYKTKTLVRSEDLPKQIDENRVMMTDGDGNEYDFGAHFHGYGKQVVKGMNVSLHEDGDQTTLNFKVNHVFRDRLEKVIDEIQDSSQEELKDLFEIYGSQVEDITISKQAVNPADWWNEFGERYEITLKGLGKITVGASNNIVTFYDKVSVQMEKGKNLYDFHEALSLLQLDDALRQSASEDIERMKIGQLFRTFDLGNATLFERSDPFFDLSLEDLKQEIFTQSPEMKKVFEEYLPRMELKEILPGRMRFGINGLAEELQEKGAVGLTAAITGVWWGKDEETYKRIASILKMGMLSHEMRDDYKIGMEGLSGGADYETGGADSVFTQIITKNSESYDDCWYWGDVRVLISPKVLETGTYQYHDDNFGNRQVDPNWWWGTPYLKRNNIFDFLTVENLWYQGENEVMIKDRIAPEFITGFVVDDISTKLDLVEYLRKCNLVQKDWFGNETIHSKPIDQFIYVGDAVKAEQFI